MRSRLAIALVVLASSAPAPARADDAEACAGAAESAQAHRSAGKLRAARAELVACGQPSCPKVVRSDCLRWLGEVDGELPTIVVRVRGGDGADVVGARITVDGETVADRVDGRPIPVDVGERQIAATVGGAVARERIVAVSGERNRVVTLVLAARAPAEPHRGLAVGPLALGGAGIALGVAGGVLWGLGRSAHDDMESTCAPAGACSTGDVDAARTKLVVGDVLVGLGLASLVGAAIWYFGAAREASASRPSVVRF